MIGFAFDGTGYGDDGAVWGGEVLLADYGATARRAPAVVPLPGGDAGVRKPWRMALSHLRTAGVDWVRGCPVRRLQPERAAVIGTTAGAGLNCAPTSSMGRLFDALSSIAGVCQRVEYEAEAAMRFEALARVRSRGDRTVRVPDLRRGRTA